MVAYLYTLVNLYIRSRARCVGPFVNARKVKRAFPKTYIPRNKIRLDPRASAVPRDMSKICRGRICGCYTNCRCSSAAVMKFDRARFDNANRSSLKSVLLVPAANGVRLGPKAGDGPALNCHSAFERRGRATSPNCCSMLLSRCRIGTRLAAARQIKMRHCACPGKRKGLVLSLGRKVCGCSNGAL